MIYHGRHSKSVLFHPTECESLEALTKVMGSGYAGCVHFTGSAFINLFYIKIAAMSYFLDDCLFKGNLQLI